MNPESEKRSWEEYISEGLVARERVDGYQWKLGDLAGLVEKDYGEDSLGKYAYAISISKKTLMNYRITAKAFSPDLRNRYKKLSFSHFKLLSAVPVPEAWLKKADDNDLSIEQLSIEVKKAYEDINNKGISDIPPKAYRCPECGQWRLKDLSIYEICRGHYVTRNGKMEFI